MTPGDKVSVLHKGAAPAMACPCCGKTDTSGVSRLSMFCWSCSAIFRETPGGVHMVECACGKHDNKKVIKSATREE